MASHQSYLSPLEYSRWAPNVFFFAVLAGRGRYRGLVACGRTSAVCVVMSCIVVRRPGTDQPSNRSGNEQTAAAWHTFLKSSEHRANGRSVAHVFEDSLRRVCSAPAPIRRCRTPSAGGFGKCPNGRSVVHKTHEQTAAAWHTFFEK